MKQLVDNNFTFSGNDERVDKLINSLRVGVLLQGPQAEILFSNKAALNMLGLTEEQLHGRSSFHPEWNVIHEDGSPFPSTTQPVPTAIATKKSVTNIVMGVYRPHTEDRIWLQVNAEPLLDDKGEVKEVICSFSDISLRKEVEKKMEWLYQSLEVRAMELASSNAELERVAYVASHDLQEPLRMVSSFMELLKKKYGEQLDEQAAEYINYAVEGANRMKSLIIDLQEFLTVASNKEGISEIDMNELVGKVILSVTDEMTSKGAEININKLPVALVNRSLIEQLIQNLISNALKYSTPDRPTIWVDCEEKEEQFLFSIRDNGIGIDPKYTETIFALFKRLHTTRDNYKGTGVGLAICKKIVERHGGNIWVESEQGKGSTFYFTINKNNY